MLTLTTAAELAAALAPARARGLMIGFVPTMGALHRGHAAVVDRSVADSDLTVTSIFVNPTQFNEAGDLAAYPRTPQSDAQLLAEHGCDYLYLPSTEDVYPNGTKSSLAADVDLTQLTAHMEGLQRPGHFDGVVQVVSRLLEIVKPTTLYLGQKDYQQVAVVRHMVEHMRLSVRVVTVETVREPDGLALSSRNRLLSPDERRAAGRINRHLAAVAAGLRAGWPARELERLATASIAATPLLEPEYVTVFDGHTLQPYQDGQPVEELVVATAVRVGPVRLIDNRIAYRANPSDRPGV
ncbi:pantoate--beta-alanine ligase [Neolewinella sp.]|uniref:pantoate--beta-alanine ligase n=1 Tax=Neolewinella sp. TaxID=2993543 RepID=UPI003B520B19